MIRALLPALLWGCAARSPAHPTQQTLTRLQHITATAATIDAEGVCALQQRALLQATVAAAERAAAAQLEHLAQGRAEDAAEDYQRLVLATQQAEDAQRALQRCGA